MEETISGPKEETRPAQATQAEWLAKWSARLQTFIKADRDALHDALKKLEADPESTPPRDLDPVAALDPDLHCDAIAATPLPYVLNVGAGYRPWSCGRRTRQGIPIVVVGADPLAFGVADAVKTMLPHFPAVARARAFTLPIAGEELSAAIPPATFDAAWSEGTLLDCLDPFRLLQQCVRAVKTGGVVCVRLGQAEDTLWKVRAANGGSISLSSDLGTQTISEVRGERLEVHTLIDGSMMLKIRRREHTQADLDKMLKRGSGLVLPPGVTT